MQDVTLAPDRLQIYRIGRIGFDLAAQPVDLDVDRALSAVAAAACQFVTRDRGPWPLCELPQQVAFAFRQLDRLVLPLEFSTPDMEGQITQPDGIARTVPALAAAQKEGGEELALEPPLLLYEANGCYTPEAAAILRVRPESSQRKRRTQA